VSDGEVSVAGVFSTLASPPASRSGGLTPWSTIFFALHEGFTPLWPVSLVQQFSKPSITFKGFMWGLTRPTVNLLRVCTRERPAAMWSRVPPTGAAPGPTVARSAGIARG
jgi:hypothetical protein